jgi:hypothetical protein
MMLFYFAFTGYEQGDENMILDTVSHTPHYVGCETQTVIADAEKILQTVDFQLYPNPVNSRLTVKTGLKNSASLQLTDYAGRIVIERKLAAPVETLDVSALPQGLRCNPEGQRPSAFAFETAGDFAIIKFHPHGMKG